MQLTGLPAAEVDKVIADFTKLMQQETRAAVFAAAQQLVKLNDDIVLVASPFDTLSAITTSWSQSVQTKLVPFLKNVYAKASQAISAPLGVDVPTTPAVLDDVTTSLTAFANELWDAGQGAVLIGWQDGETVGVMSDRVQDVAKAKSKKAASIAQTAITTTVNGGEWSTMLAIASKFNAITTKEWVATHDSHTRPTHWAADGQVVALNQKFSVGDALLDFPGDPFGALDEIINCRCTTRYDSDVQAVNSSPQTSPDALSADSEYQPLEWISASAATNPNWKSSDHPRGKDGKFIKKGVGLPNYVFSALTHLGGGGSFSSMSGVDQSSFLAAVPEITDAQWANLKDDQKLAIEQAIGDALDDGVPGSAAAQKHLDVLSSDDDTSADDVDLFDPATPLPPSPTPAGGSTNPAKANVMQDIHTAHANDQISDEQYEELLDFSTLANVSADDLQEMLDDAVIEHDGAPGVTHDSTPLVPPGGAELTGVYKQISEAANAGFISHDKETELMDALALGEITDAEAQQQLVNAMGSPATPSAPLTTGSPKPVKITHGLIHAKHAPGTVIAQDANGNAIVWNGTSYDIEDADGEPLAQGVKKSKLYALLNDFYADTEWHEPGPQPVTVTHATPLDAAPPANPIPHPVAPATMPNVNSVQPQAIDDLLDGEPVSHGSLVHGVNMMTQENWDALFPGDQDAIAHAVDMAWGKTAGAGDAKAKIENFKKPPATFPAPSTVDSALDDAFGPMNPGLAAPSSTINVPSAAVDPLSLGELPTATEADLLASLKKLHDVGFINDKDYKDLTDGVKSGKLFMGKMVVGSHNTKVQQANYVAPPLTPTHIPNPTFTPGPKPIGTPLTALAVVTHSGDFASGEVHATGTNPWGDAWSVAPAPGGNLYVQQDGQPYATAMSYPDFVALTNDQQIQWEAMDGSVSIFPAMGMAAKKTVPPVHAPAPAAAVNDKLIAGESVFSDQIVNSMDAYAPGDIIATGKDNAGDTWTVSKGPSGEILLKVDASGSSSPPVEKTPDQLHYTTSSYDIQWVASGLGPAKKAAPAKTTAPTPPAAITPAQEKEFYKHFKAENVSPAWSGAKIYASMQAAKLKMAGNPAFANLTDAQMLEILDKQHNLAKATTGTAYSTKTKEWLKTPNGIKAFKEANGIPTYSAPSKFASKKVAKKTFGKKAAPSYTPYTPPSSSPTKSTPTKASSTLPGVPIKTTGPMIVSKKAAPVKKVAPAKKAVATGITPSEALGDVSAPPSTTNSADVYAQFKASGYGKYLNESTPEEIYWNATQIGKTMGLSPGQVLALIDAEGAKKFGVPNAKSFEKKVTDWLATNSGQVTAARIKSGDWKPHLVKKATSGAGYKYSADTPLNEKVDDVSGHVPPFDENMSSADFPVITPTAAHALWAEMQATHGDMTDSQKASLYHYTTNTGFSNMNNYLRGAQGASQATQNHVDTAQAGMRPSTRNITIHRGNGTFTDGAGRPWTSYETISQYVGTDLHQEAFFSASVGGNAAFGGAISMEIEVPAGTPMAYVNAFSAYGQGNSGNANKGEREMLLAANLTYRIIEVKKNGHQTIVRMRVVPTSEASS